MQKIAQRLLNFCQSGEISPNLVALDLEHEGLLCLNVTVAPTILYHSLLNRYF